MPAEKRSESRRSETSPAEEFARQAEGSSPGLVREFWDFLRYYKKWWLLPIIIVLVLLGFLVMLSGSPIFPFIYPFF